MNGTKTTRKLGSRDNPLKVCFAGLMMSSKGAHILVEAMISLRRQGVYVEGCIAGDSFQAGYQEYLEEQVRKYRIENIIFTGQLSRSSLARCMQLHHVCVFPSIHPEAFGIVGAEAMASGLVLVSSGVGGAKELFVHEKTGFLFKPGDSTDLAERLKWLCTNPELMKHIGESAREHANKVLSVEESARKLERLFQIYRLNKFRE